jgi:hypothetical protein
MRRVLAATFGLATSALYAFGVGCTFLVPFEDAPTEAGADIRSPRPRDGNVIEPADATVTEEAATLPPPSGNCDQFPKMDEIEGCQALVENGQVCGDSNLLKFPAGHDPSAFVVTCSKVNGAICVKECTGPGKCVHLPSGFPDVCDQCEDRVGTYCGKDMPGWPPANFGLLVACKDNRAGEIIVCDAGCTAPEAGAAYCTPR